MIWNLTCIAVATLAIIVCGVWRIAYRAGYRARDEDHRLYGGEAVGRRHNQRDTALGVLDEVGRRERNARFPKVCTSLCRLLYELSYHWVFAYVIR